jgi:hypothetical protein
MSISLSFGRADDVAELSMAVNKELLISLSIALAAGATWTALCVALGWPLLGVAGIVLGLIVGSAACGYLRADANPIAGMATALIAVVLLCVGTSLARVGDGRSALAVAESDESYVTTIAEQIAWERAASTPDERNSSTSTEPLAVPDSNLLPPPGIAPVEISTQLRHEAEERWASMPAEEKQKLRDERRRWMTHTLGANLDRFERTPTGWPLATVASLTGVAALLSAAWPALVGRYLPGDR